ncbi:MAG: pilus assembly protein [Deltaproteobacteria bacterium]|nr:pilus assembly protein [Deltaproteobacteria bacterium]
MPLMRCNLGDNRGISLVELSIILPMLMLLLGGIVDVGLTLRTYQVVSEAARQAARVGSGVSCADAPGVAVDTATNFLTNAGYKVQEVKGDETINHWIIAAVQAQHQEGLGTAAFDECMLRVSIDQNTPSCVICLGETFLGLRANAESTFAMEPGCKCP